MVAQKNPDGEIGPPKQKEFFYFHGDAKGKPFPLIVAAGSNLKLGVLNAFEWLPKTVKRDKGITAVEGIVTNMDGRPVEGVLVFAYLSRDATGKPVFISERTDNNGRYQLRVHDGGSFYLKVRGVYGGGVPREGEFLNVTEEFEPVAVELKKDQILRGVTLQAKKFSRPGAGSTNVPPAPPDKVWKNIGVLQHAQ